MPVRLAELQDAAAITALINAAFAVERFFIDSDRITVGQVEALLLTGEFLLLEEHGALAGCVYLETRRERVYLGLLSISPARQRGGLGSRLMAAAEAHCLARGLRFIDLLIVNLRKELPPYYRRLGYAESGVSPFTPGVQTVLPCHFVKMSKELASTSPPARASAGGIPEASS
jgi:N-acetylglutamate synthase-like GNAT family acetyltransferase